MKAQNSKHSFGNQVQLYHRYFLIIHEASCLISISSFFDINLSYLGKEDFRRQNLFAYHREK